MSDAAHADHGNKWVAMAAGVFALLLAGGIGFFILGTGWTGLGSGIANFINNVGNALDIHPRMGMLLALFCLAITGGLAMVALRKSD